MIKFRVPGLSNSMPSQCQSNWIAFGEPKAGALRRKIFQGAANITNVPVEEVESEIVAEVLESTLRPWHLSKGFFEDPSDRPCATKAQICTNSV